MLSSKLQQTFGISYNRFFFISKKMPLTFERFLREKLLVLRLEQKKKNLTGCDLNLFNFFFLEKTRTFVLKTTLTFGICYLVCDWQLKFICLTPCKQRVIFTCIDWTWCTKKQVFVFGTHSLCSYSLIHSRVIASKHLNKCSVTVICLFLG